MPRRVLVFVFALLTCLLPLPALAQTGAVAPTLLVDQNVERLHLEFPQDPTVTWFVDAFGAHRGDHRHIGIDMHAPKGSPVYAVAPGVVTRMAISGRAGAYLVVDHGSGWTSWYMHLDNDDPGTDNGRGGFATAFATGIEVGSFVDAGQIIGHVGDSGNAEGTVPHTHFELHRNGRPVDPYWMLVESHARALMALEAERLAVLVARIV